jgi:5-methylcytosine-specific restriction endonuclease McrA
MSLNRLGKYHSDESKQKMSKAALGKPKTKFTCSYCGKVIGGHSNIIRHENSHKHTN